MARYEFVEGNSNAGFAVGEIPHHADERDVGLARAGSDNVVRQEVGVGHDDLRIARIARVAPDAVRALHHADVFACAAPSADVAALDVVLVDVAARNCYESCVSALLRAGQFAPSTDGGAIVLTCWNAHD